MPIAGVEVQGLSLVSTFGNATVINISSSVGTINVSSSLDFPNTDKTYHIRATRSHLILSSSVGSVIQVSGALKIIGGKTIVQGLGVNGSPDLYSSADATSGLMFSNGTVTLVAGGANILQAAAAGVTQVNGTSFNITSNLIASNACMILSSSTGSAIAISGALRVFNNTTGSLAAPPIGSVIWNTTTNQLAVYNGAKWFPLASGAAL